MPLFFPVLFPHAAGLACILLLAACGGGGESSSSATADAAVAREDRAAPTALTVGQKIFHDRSLSSSGRLACASCHDPAHGHGSPFDAPIASGGLLLNRPGTRLAPGLRYLRYNSAFHFDDDGTPTGGFDWDGRARNFSAQAERPLLADNEMGNGSKAEVVAKLARAPYADEFRAVFGVESFSDVDTAFDRLMMALEQYQHGHADLAPFTSKFDRVTAGKATFDDAELRGLAWFNRADKGNCAACHPSTKPANAPAALFTDFTYDALGVPRNPAIEANRDPAYFDLGLCGPARQDLAARADLCGAFKVPSLRNVALRKRFFHNGAFDSLEQVVRFYVQRDTNPERWYPPGADGSPDKFNDLPPALRGNVNTGEPPYDRKRGEAPRLTESEVQDLVAFLRTLSDGWTPSTP